MILKLGAVWFQTTHPLVSAPQWHKHQNLTDLIDELLSTKFEQFVSWREKLLLCSWVCLGDLVRPKPLLKDPTIKYFSTFILFFCFLSATYHLTFQSHQIFCACHKNQFNDWCTWYPKRHLFNGAGAWLRSIRQAAVRSIGRTARGGLVEILCPWKRCCPCPEIYGKKFRYRSQSGAEGAIKKSSITKFNILLNVWCGGACKTINWKIHLPYLSQKNSKHFKWITLFCSTVTHGKSGI